ncbi:HPr family phosphocarrier protein [Agromyces subbeticus]|uniref:HPr family phosphocarrier protein n=1 Tax=Agromyces subbeticus TaxID=293890 RepID=UPI0003B30680|nr:HPr family phosphocarrier protein [Agromyces subbeticus]
MQEQTVRIGSTHGLHARPAKLFTQAVAASGATVMLSKSGGTPVNAASILGVISQGIDHGDEVTLVVEGGDERAVLEQLIGLLSTDHDD